MMAEYFENAGFDTAAIDNLYDGWRPRHPYYPWFRRGYTHYNYPKGEGHYRPGSEVSSMACRWLDSVGGEPFMLFVHYWDTHAPYNKAPKQFYRFYQGQDPCNPHLDCMAPNVREAQRRTFGMPITDPAYVVSAYHAETAYVDSCIGVVLRKLEGLGLSGETVVAITSDHGDIMPPARLALGRYWAFCHIGLNEDCLRIPLVISGPGIASGVRVPNRFQLVDILPTLLDLAEVSHPALDGSSLAPALRGNDLDGRSGLFFSENTYQKQRAMLAWPWKYMRMETHYESMPARCLYKLDEDPRELRNLSDERADVVQEMDRDIQDYVSGCCRGQPDPIRAQATTAKM
jgi:arylsulfatase A-like enzyme